MISLGKPLDKCIISQLFGKEFAYYDPTTGTYYQFYHHYGLLGHPGIDYACPVGTPVKSAHDGVCMYAGYDDTNGNMVQIWNEKEGYKTLYGHNSEILVKAGDQVKRGQVIALSGATGAGTGPHLHFGFKFTGNGGNSLDINNGYNGCVDPLPFIEKTMFTFKKVIGDKNVWICNEDTKMRSVFLDMVSMKFFTDKFEEVNNLEDYKIYGTQATFERTILD